MEKEELKGSNKQETMDKTHNQDSDLETIRYYHGTWKNFFDYWQKRGVKVDPYEGEEMIHPYKGAKSNSKLPVQDFHTYDKAEMNDRIAESYDEFVFESAINEIGDSQPMDWKLIDTDKQAGSVEYIYQFDTPGETYEVNLTHFPSQNRINVEFSIGGDTQVITNSGIALPVLSTVMDIVKDFIRTNPKLKEIGFVPSKADETDSRREKIYIYYIKKNFPGAKIRKQEIGFGQSNASSIDVIL